MIACFWILWAAPVSASALGPGPCLADSQVPFQTRTSANWSSVTTPWNLRLSYKPVAVVNPTNVDQIKAAIRCAAVHGVRVSCKAGGHSFGAFGLGGEDGHLVVALDNMSKITVHNDSTATIQPGARLGDVALGLYNQGRRAIAHGECPDVGIAGHVLHGGVGLISRPYGLTLDWLQGATVVLANATVVRCSRTQHQELFWALRGAGSSFGIVVEFEFRTFAAPEPVTVFTIAPTWRKDQAARAITKIQDFALSAPKELNMNLIMREDGQSIQGVYYGERYSLNATIHPLLTGLHAGLSEVKSLGWIQGLEHLAGGQKLNDEPDALKHDWFYATNAVTPALTDEQIRSLVDFIYTNVDSPTAFHDWSYILEFYGGRESAVSQVKSWETAFPHRDMALLHQFSSVESPNYTDYLPGFSMFAQFRESITNIGAWGMYANYIDTQINSSQAQELYWGRNLDRLREIKDSVDADQVFWNPQGIMPV